MGLFSKLRGRLGRLGRRVGSISGRFVGKRSRRILGRVGRVAGFGARLTPVGRVVGLAGTALAVVGLSGALRRRRQRKAGTVPVAVSGTAAVRGVSRLGRLGLIAAGVGAAAFVGEQIAERLGVRGGAGFVGRRPRKAVAKTRKRRKKKVRRIRRHGHKVVRLKARTVVRSIRRKKKTSRKGKRVSFTTASGQKVSFIAIR